MFKSLMAVISVMVLFFGVTLLQPNQGGTGLDTSGSTGVVQVASGAWNVSIALANGTTATTQAVGDNSTKVATDAFVYQNTLYGPNPSVVGGIMGGYYGGSVSSTLQPWANGASNTTKAVNSLGIWFDHPTVYYSAAIGASSLNNYTFQTTDGNNTQSAVDLGIISLSSATSSGAYGEHSNAQPFYTSQNLGGSLKLNASAGAGSNIRGYSWQVIDNNIQPLGWANSGCAGLNGSSTAYFGFGQGCSTPTEKLTQIVSVDGFTASDLCVWTAGAQPGDGTLTFALRQNGSTTALTYVIPVSGSASVYCDHNQAHNITLAAADLIDIIAINASASTSATVSSISITLTPTGTAKGMIVFPTGGQTIASTSAKYFPPFGNVAASTTEANVRAPMPRALTLKNYYCLCTTAPGTNSVVATVFKNGSGPASGPTITIPTTSCSTPITYSDTTDSASFSYLDQLDEQFNQTSGTNPAISGCSIGVY